MRRLRSSLSYANVASSLALFLAVGGGTAVAAATISSSDIQNSAVTKSKIARNAVSASKIANGAVSNRDLRDNSVLGADLRDGTVASVDLADSGVQTADVADGAITKAKLAPGVIPDAPPSGGGGPAAHGVVSAAGALARGAGVAAVAQPSPGIYAVTFTRDVNACTPVVSIGGTLAPDDPDGRVGAGTVTASPSGASNATILVQTRNLAGSDAARAFSFVVWC